MAGSSIATGTMSVPIRTSGPFSWQLRRDPAVCNSNCGVAPWGDVAIPGAGNWLIRVWRSQIHIGPMMNTPPIHDFYDFGCSQGGSIAHAMKHFGGKCGLGIDVDARKVEATRARGFEAEVLDILTLPEKKQVRFVTMMHFLEHLDSYATASAMLRMACAVSREFVYVAQPFF